jgi:hypothetical protein
MKSSIYNIDSNVFNTFANSIKRNQLTAASFNYVNRRVSRRFTQVGALGKIRNYSRVEMLSSFFMEGF